MDVDAVIAALTVEEKAALCLGSDFWHTAPVPRLDVPAIMVSDGPHGLRAQPEEKDHLGLSGSLPATCFPTASALASSWHPALFGEIGRALAIEALACGVSVVLGPGINMKRSPLCGRNFEYLSEDPWLAGELAVAMVDGVQSRGIGTSLKHFAANNQEEDRLRVSADVDERTLREIYLPAFERVVTKAQPWTVMCAYNKVNGTFASEHHWLLTSVLRDEWGFEGLVVSDWGAVHDRVAALAAGLDLEMPPNLGVSDQAIVDAIAHGTLAESVLDQAVGRVLRLVGAAQSALAPGATFDVDAHHDLARRAAYESAVLLKNDGGALPLRPAPGETIAVIGEFARTPRYQGAGSSQVNATRVDTALDELTRLVEPSVQVRFAADTTDAAVELARLADHVVMFLGLPASAESEGFDRTHIDLPPDQLELLSAVAAVHDRVVVVLANGSAVRLSPWDGQVAAILECWLSGQASGGAAAALLLGRANPSGKLAESIPLRLEDNSSYLNFPGDSGHVRYGEGIFIGYRGYDRAKQDVSHPFGFGLSYTTFSVTDVTVEVHGAVGSDLRADVSATVTNTGPVGGAEVVQVYVADLVSTVARPVRELKAFARVSLEPGASERVMMTLDERSFAFWSIVHGRWAVEAGEFEIGVGTSSRDLVDRAVISLDAPSLAAPLNAMSTLQEWLADPAGSALLHELDTAAALSDEEFVRVIGTMPMDTLAGFPGTGIDHATLRSMIDQL
jgi:beta-glucosidase